MRPIRLPRLLGSRHPGLRMAGLLAALAALLVALPASSQEGDQEDPKKSDEEKRSEIRPYIEYSAGLAIVRNQNVTNADGSGAGINGGYEADVGYNVGGAIGMRFLENFRAEINLGYREVDATNLNTINESQQDATGDVSLFSAMLNAYADYDFGIYVIPYFGLGIGYGIIDADIENRANSKIKSDASVFVWNAMIGGSVKLSEITEVSLGYRYLAVEDFEQKAVIAEVGPRRIDSEFDSHEIVAGVRFTF